MAMNKLKQSVFFAIAYGICVTTANAASLGDQWYIGLGGGSTWLQPNPTQVGLDIKRRLGVGGSVFVGTDIDDRSSAQVTLYTLGDSELDNRELVAFQALDGSVLYRLYDTKDVRLSRSGMHLALYGRFALGFLNRDTDVKLENDSKVYFGAGAGAEWFINNAFSVRLEGMYLDKDASHGSLQLVGRFGGRRVGQSGQQPKRQPAPQPADSTIESAELQDQPATTEDEITEDETTEAETTEAVEPTESLEPVEIIEPVEAVELIEPVETIEPIEADKQIEPEQLAEQAEVAELIEPIEPTVPSTPETDTLSAIADQDGDNVPDADDQCLASRPGYPVRSSGCALFDGVLSGVNFAAGSTALLPDATDQLDFLANVLIRYPDARIELHAHTDNGGTVKEQTALTRERVRTIGAYLVTQGVTVDRMLLRSFGGSRPLYEGASGQSIEGNNRVEVIESRN